MAFPAIYVLLLFRGPWITSPIVNYGGLIGQPLHRMQSGFPTIDPNIAYTSFALGARAAKDLLHLHWPLWNPFEGLGTPLLGEMQSAALFPLTPLLLLPGGQAIEDVILQIIGGLGFYALARALRFRRASAFTVAFCFEFCALFVWLKFAVVNLIPFLIWLLVFSLRLIQEASQRSVGDSAWMLPTKTSVHNILGLALAAACAVFGGYPEVVFIFTVFLTGWVTFYSLVTLSAWRHFARLALNLFIAFLVACCVAAPVLLAFLSFVPDASFAGHLTASWASAHLGPVAAVRYLFPYIGGPIFAYPAPANDSMGGIGGYCGVALPLLALLGLLTPGRLSERLFWAATIFIFLGATQGLGTAHQLLMLIPGMKLTALYRQANIVWFTAILLLAGHALESGMMAVRWRFIVALVLMGAMIAAIVSVDWHWLATLTDTTGTRHWMAASFLIGAGLLILAAIGIVRKNKRLVIGAVATETLVTFLLPALSYPTAARIDNAMIAFLQNHAGYQRVVNMNVVNEDMLEANFGSYFQIPLLNYNDIPAPTRTAKYIQTNLDPYYSIDGLLFLPGWGPPTVDEVARQKEMVRRLDAYAAVGVKYVLTPPKLLPQRNADAKLVFSSFSGDVYKLRGARPFFAAPGCVATPHSFDEVALDCRGPSALTRLELWMPGWQATVDGVREPIAKAAVFQRVEVPAGRHTVSFDYNPYHLRAVCVAGGISGVVFLAIFFFTGWPVRAQPETPATFFMTPPLSAASARRARFTVPAILAAVLAGLFLVRWLPGRFVLNEASNPPKFVSESKIDRVEDCSLDTIDGRLFRSLKEPIALSNDQLDVAGRTVPAVSVAGWTAPAARRGIGPDETWISLTAADGKRRFYPADAVKRPDVLAAFRQPEMKSPGFAADLDLSGLTGTEKLAIYSVHNNIAYRCPQQAVLQLGPNSPTATRNATSPLHSPGG
jgi:hypothetical protein